MRPFAMLTDEQRSALFHVVPELTARDAHNQDLAAALGATLYMPGTRSDLMSVIQRAESRGITSVVVCLEDAIPDDAVPQAQRNVVELLRGLAAGTDAAVATLPQIYVRVRHADQLTEIADEASIESPVLSGFVAPKFTAANGPEYLDAVTKVSASAGRRVLVMPVLETADVAYAETRVASLTAIEALLNAHREHVPAIRIGGTDLAGLFALRRGRDATCYDLGPVRDTIAAIVNVFGRTDGTGVPVSGCVWEYYKTSDPVLRPQVRSTPFVRSHAESLRSRLLGEDLDGLVREVLLDKANGLVGKTVIHPSHVPIVNALQVVTHEEWDDAMSVQDGVGSYASSYRNKMNESNPHGGWARAVLGRARAFGVLAEGATFADLLTATT